MIGINYNGLKRRQTYDELVNYIETDPTRIRDPNRAATFAERSHYMKHLGGEDYIEMEEQQLRVSKEKVKEEMLRRRSALGEGPGSGTHSLSRFLTGRVTPSGVPGYFIGTEERRLADDEGEEMSSIHSVIAEYGNQPLGRELRENVQRSLEEQLERNQQNIARLIAEQERMKSQSEYIPGVPPREQPGTAQEEEVEPIPEQAMQGYKSVIETSALSDTNLKVSEVYEDYPDLFKAYEGLINDINSKTDQAINMALLRTQKIQRMN